MADKKVLVTGLSAVDVMIVCDQYPKEDEKGKALSHCRQRGGNAANVSEVLARLGVCTELFSNLEIGQDGDFVKSELSKYSVDISNCKSLKETGFPTSYCILSKGTNTRTVLHSRSNAYEPKYDDFVKTFGAHFNEYSWMHFEGRGFPDVCSMVQLLRKEKLKGESSQVMPMISVELERIKSSDELIKGVLPFADVAFISKDFVKCMGYETALEAALQIKSDQKLQDDTIIIIPDGELGAHAVDQSNNYYHCDAAPMTKVIDTNGAGDTLIAAVISCLVNGRSLMQALEFGCALAGKKCGILGFKDLI